MKLLLVILLFTTPNLVSAQDFIYKKKYDKYVFKIKGIKSSDQKLFDDYANNYNGTWFVKNGDSWRIIKSNGSFYNDDEYSQVVDMRNGYYRLKLDGKFGVIDRKSLELKMKFEYDLIDYYSDNKSIYLKGGNWYVMEDNVGKIVSNPTIYNFPEQPLVYKGCEDENFNCSERKMLESIYGNIQYPANAREQNIQGEVIYEVVIGKDGKMISYKNVESIGGGCDEEALRVIQISMNDWIPAKQSNDIVDVKLILSVKYRLE